jgi:phage baseplate assembly protein W|tara:strand:+ start:16774 stop:17151 length:378 start_codon:yes stop_codon:yes gene_type:complete
MNFGYSPKLPLTTTMVHYDMIDDIRENIKQNFKNLLLTSPGERIMIPDFGVGLRRYLFELDKEVIFQEVSSRIVSQVETYLSFITLTDISLAERGVQQNADETMGIIISYTLDDLGLNDEIQIFK